MGKKSRSALFAAVPCRDVLVTDVTHDKTRKLKAVIRYLKLISPANKFRHQQYATQQL